MADEQLSREMQSVEIRRAGWERAAIVVAAVLAGILSWALFSTLPPMQVLVGTQRVALRVPVWYQVSVFPAFGAFIAAAGLDALAQRNAWWVRAVAGATLMLLAAARLSETIPISGHGLCCSALMLEAAIAPRRPETTLVAALAASSLLITGWFKLFVWGDAMWFAVSLVAGSIIGAVAGAAQRSRIGQG